MRGTARNPAPTPWRLPWAVLFTIAAAIPAQAQPAGEAVDLARMYAAVRNLDYEGTFVYLRGGQPDAMRIFHAGGEPERERIVGLGGAPAEYARVGADIVCESGTSPATLFDNPGARLLPLVPDLRGSETAKYYNVVGGTEDRVAGYVARRVDVVPRDGFRYGYRLWLERESGFPLRSTILDGSRRVLEEYLFVTLDLGKRPRDTDLAASSPASAVGGSHEDVVRDPRWTVHDAPPGFVRVKVERAAGAAEGSEHQVYTDGIANVSVYVEPRAPGEGSERGYSRGMVNILTREAGAWRTTGIGDVPRATLERMVRSVRPVEAAEDRLKDRGDAGTSPPRARQ